MAKNAITKYKNFIDYNDEYEYSSKIKSNKSNKSSEEDISYNKKKKQKKFSRVSANSYFFED